MCNGCDGVKMQPENAFNAARRTVQVYHAEYETLSKVKVTRRQRTLADSLKWVLELPAVKSAIELELSPK